jgi:hypothetical protein
MELTRLKTNIHHLPIELISIIISYSYSPQPIEITKDILSYFESKSIIQGLFYMRYKSPNASDKSRWKTSSTMFLDDAIDNIDEVRLLLENDQATNIAFFIVKTVMLSAAKPFLDYLFIINLFYF